MKATGIVRRVDDLGRVVIPKELRNTLGIEDGDPLEIFTQDNLILLRKYAPGCVFCGSAVNLQMIGGKRLCRACISEIAERR